MPIRSRLSHESSIQRALPSVAPAIHGGAASTTTEGSLITAPLRSPGPLVDAAKWLLDRVAAAIALLLLSPLFLALGVIVRRDSPGPAIYRRRVMGRAGTEFDAFKFRSMHLDGDAIIARYPDLAERLAREEKLPHDPRITRSGAWMRKLSLDELPQLVNVLRGQMSLVGPRMISPPELKRFGPYADELLTVRPALTGPWQISGRADLPYEERVRLDIHYIRTRSFWGDLRLLLLTVPAVLKGRGAY